MTTKSTLNIAILGVGAMGCLFGSRLSDLAHVTLIGNWAEQIETVCRAGLTITSADGRQTQHSLHLTNDLAGVPPADIALILVKSHQTARAARQAAQVLKPDGLAITLQNGLGNLEIVAQAVGPQRAGLGITAQGATMLGPGHLYHAGQGPTHLAKIPGYQGNRLAEVVALFNAAGLETTLVDNADSLVWGKLAINAGINPLTALLEVPNGRLAEDENLRQMMAAAANEVAQVAAAQGIHLPYTDAARRAAEVSKATAGNRSSMLQDVSRAAPTEIDAISGAVVRFGQRLGIPTPVNEFLLRMVKSKEAGLPFNRPLHLTLPPTSA
ncbi:MAG TPA: 2-dehydropantoate 2-reductase [Anaerolineae bacterium]|nr:2-dehydropantoate 2-reductase [Anaerolineae bacterium]